MCFKKYMPNLADQYDQMVKNIAEILVSFPEVLFSAKNKHIWRKSIRWKKTSENKSASAEAQLQYGFIHKNHHQTY